MKTFHFCKLILFFTYSVINDTEMKLIRAKKSTEIPLVELNWNKLSTLCQTHLKKINDIEVKLHWNCKKCTIYKYNFSSSHLLLNLHFHVHNIEIILKILLKKCFNFQLVVKMFSITKKNSEKLIFLQDKYS